eukprot:14463380-Alexandrium_andersonii.AAC.1
MSTNSHHDWQAAWNRSESSLQVWPGKGGCYHLDLGVVSSLTATSKAAAPACMHATRPDRIIAYSSPSCLPASL